MTQTVLSNQVSELAPKSWMDPDQRREVADGLANGMADAYRLLINVQGLHWNVEGPMFYSLHKLTEDQYRELFESIDQLAERIRALGFPAPQSIKAFSDRSIVSDLPDDADLKGHIQSIISGYERAARRAAQVVKVAEANGDIKTADLLTERVGMYEESAWMLRATIAS